MMWKNFDGKPYTREEFLAHVTALPPIHWAKFVTLHNTGSPTLEQCLAYMSLGFRGAPHIDLGKPIRACAPARFRSKANARSH